MNPRLIENIWTLAPHEETSYVTTPWENYAVPTASANIALTVRAYCTGHNTPDTIAERTGLHPNIVTEIIDSFAGVGILDTNAGGPVDIDIARRGLIAATELWGHELARGYIGNRFADGDLHLQAVIGWLVEMYHYIHDFPEMIRHAERNTNSLALSHVLHTYAQQETGHEHFVLDTLVNLGVTVEEVENSTPLVSTRTISQLIRGLVEYEPAAMLLVAALVEARDFNEEAIHKFTAALTANYGIPPQAFDPYFQHQQIDFDLGHAELLERNINLLTVVSRPRLDRITNELHDIKHAFDLQTLDILDYYGDLNGRYLPRQPMRFSAIEPPTADR